MKRLAWILMITLAPALAAQEPPDSAGGVDPSGQAQQQRQPLRARQREITATLNGELAAGTPNPGRVTQLMNERQENQRRLQEINRSEDREMQAYLSPVQRARYQEE